MIATHEAICFGGVLGRLQIVGNRYDWEQDEQENCQGYELHWLVDASAGG